MENTERIAYIREAECIGCTKCIQACPVDAIVGAAQLMHTVIKDLCIGCDLCVPPCPVDCIDMVEIDSQVTAEQEKEKSRLAKQRFQSRKLRLKNEALRKEAERQQRIADFKASPEASALVQRAMEKARAARAGRSDADRVQASIEKLEQKLAEMKEERALILHEKALHGKERIAELDRRIATWEQKLADTREDAKRF